MPEQEFYVRYENQNGTRGLGNIYATRSYIDSWSRRGFTFYDANTGECLSSNKPTTKSTQPTPPPPPKGFAAFARSKL